MNDLSNPAFWTKLVDVLLQGTWETLYMVAAATLFTILIGLPLGIVLVGTERRGFLSTIGGSRTAAAVVHEVLAFIVNLGRSVPFIILMIALIPVTRLIVGTFVGTTAAIVPLSAVAIPFFARIVEIALNDVSPDLIEAADALGATRWLLIRRVLLTEALPAIVLGLATTITSIVNFSAMVGVVGGGGLGNVALTYGWQRYSWVHIVAVIVLLFVLVQLVQGAANRIARRVGHRADAADPARARRALARRARRGTTAGNPHPIEERGAS